MDGTVTERLRLHLEEVRALHWMATPRPWYLDRHEDGTATISYGVETEGPSFYQEIATLPVGQSQGNGEFIVAACNAVMALLDRLEAAEKALAALEAPDGE